MIILDDSSVKNLISTVVKKKKLIKLIKVHLMACQKASSTNLQVSIIEGHIASQC